jgi:uncharacterized membrane protein
LLYSASTIYGTECPKIIINILLLAVVIVVVVILVMVVAAAAIEKGDNGDNITGYSTFMRNKTNLSFREQFC